MAKLNLNAIPKTLVAAFPAYNVYKREARDVRVFRDGASQLVEGVTEIDVNDRLCFARQTRNHGMVYGEFYAGSVVSYALENGECPLEAAERAKERGHDLHWINGSGASLVSHQRAVWDMIELTEGMLVRFEGRFFTIGKAPNDNLRLIPHAI